jgi:hypothetical protein
MERTLSTSARRLTTPVRLTLASSLGGAVDGAWWPHTAWVSRELPELVDLLRTPLGRIADISVNWTPSDISPNLNSFGWEAAHQQLMMIAGETARANLLVVPYRTSVALAVMVLRQAAGLPIDPSHRDTTAFRTACCILRAARAESASCRPRMRTVTG